VRTVLGADRVSVGGCCLATFQRGFLQREQQNDISMEFLGSHSATFPTLAGLRNNAGPPVCHGLSGRCHVVVLLVTIERVGGGENEE